MAQKRIETSRSTAKRSICSLLIGSLIASACATTGYRAQLLESVSEPDRQRCDEYAQMNLEDKPSPSAEDKPSPAGEFLLLLIALPLWAPYLGAGLLVSPILVPQVLSKMRRERETRYELALKECLEPLILEAKLGPEHPDLARSLRTLAYRFRLAGKYPEAEHFYRRVLAIQEKVLGSEHLDLSETLEDYAAVLAKLDRQSDAEEATTRYLAIRAKLRDLKVSPEKNGSGREMVEANEIGNPRTRHEDKTIDEPDK